MSEIQLLVTYQIIISESLQIGSVLGHQEVSAFLLPMLQLLSYDLYLTGYYTALRLLYICCLRCKGENSKFKVAVPRAASQGSRANHAEESYISGGKPGSML